MRKINLKKILATLLLSLVLFTSTSDLTEISYNITCNYSVNDNGESKTDTSTRH